MEDVADWHEIANEVVVRSVNFQQLVEMYILKSIRELVATLSDDDFGIHWGRTGVWVAVINTADALFPEVEIEFRYAN